MFRKLLIFVIIYKNVFSSLLSEHKAEFEEFTKLISQFRPGDVKIEDVTFYVSTRTIQEELWSDEVKSNFNFTNPTKFLIHGYLDSKKTPWYKEITEEYLKFGDFNIIKVNWERVGRSIYSSAAMNAKLIGNIIGDFILNHNFNLDKVHVLGMSLGGHVAGFAGKRIKSKNQNRIYRITGLDPAGPYFNDPAINKTERLDKEDAKIVDVIHTDSANFGYREPIGSLDIYANGGKDQPGCDDKSKLTDDILLNLKFTFCNHMRCTDYFIESINKGKFVCVKCDLKEFVENGNCKSEDNIYRIGAEDITAETTGTCFAKTNADSPYL